MSSPDATEAPQGQPSLSNSRKLLTSARRCLAVVLGGLIRAIHPRTVVAGVTGGVTAVVVFGLWNPLVTWSRSAPIRDTFGKIIVESPEVYTRERLVNDRLRQAVWLRKQMGATEDVLKEGLFRSHEGQFVQHVSAAMSLQSTDNGDIDQPGMGGVAVTREDVVDSKPVPKHSDDAPAVNTPVFNPMEVGTSMELFRAMNEYREQVRTELMQTQLDDRHDIDGNTLYRLNFNTTIVHGRSSDALAVIRVELEHGDSLDESGEGFYEALLREWSQELERRLNEAAESQMRLLIREGAQDRDDSEFYLWLRWKICKKLTRIARLSSGTESGRTTVDAVVHEIEKRNRKRPRESPESIDAALLFHAYECGDRYYHESALEDDDETRTESKRGWLDWIIRDYVDRFRIGKPAQDWFLNYSDLRLELLGEIRLRLKEKANGTNVIQRNPVGFLRHLEYRWCQNPLTQHDTSKEKTDEPRNGHMEFEPPNLGPMDAPQAAPAQADPTQTAAPTPKMREENIILQHCARIKPRQREPGQKLPTFAVMDLYWHLEHLEKQLLAHDEVSKGFHAGTRFDDVGCRSTVRERVERMLSDRQSIQDDSMTDAERETMGGLLDAERAEIDELLDVKNGLTCIVEDQPWLWRRNLAIEQRIDQFNRRFLDADVRISGGTGVLAGIIRVEEVGCEAALCRISVKPMIKPARKIRTGNGENRSVDDPVNCFFRRLDEDYEAFSYGVTPKNWRQRVAFSSAVARNLAVSLETPALVGTEVRGLFERVRREEEALRSVINHPIVIGFGRGRKKSRVDKLETRDETECGSWVGENSRGKRLLSRDTEFGWIIAPEKQWGDGGGKWHPHRQYDLSAVISLPSWWRRVKLTVSSCWRKFGDLENVGIEYIDGCGGKGDNGIDGDSGQGDGHSYFIKIPGDVGEVSRKLRIEVREVPYILTEMYTPSVGQYVFHVGKKADIVIEGGRLWRSTLVTLGTQSADEIFVLPHMEGIVATFDCVRRPPYSPLPKELVTRNFPEKVVVYGAKVQVWTSEGVTVPHLPVSVVEVDTIDDEPCPDEDDPKSKRFR